MTLALLCLFFLFISPLYAHGLWRIFGARFKWHWASVIGIAVVVTTTTYFLWSDSIHFWSTLVLVFLSALPGMIWHGEKVYRDGIKTRQLLRDTQNKVIELDIRNNELEIFKDDILPLLRRIEQSQNDETKLVTKLTGILNLHLWELNSEKDS